MALEDFAKTTVFYDADALKYVNSIKHTTESGQVAVEILEIGLAGFTPGAGKVTITVSGPVPKGGTEKPYQADCANGRYVTLQLQEGAQYYIGQGKILDTDGGQDVGASTEFTFNWHGQLKPMEG